MKIKSLFLNRFAAVLAGGMMGVGSVHAAPVTYDLTYSNNADGHISGDQWMVTDDIPNGTTYATVTIDDNGDGLINFTVTLSSFWDNIKDSGFGIQSFGFNVDGVAIDLVDTNVINANIADNWGATVSPDSLNQDGLGAFDVTINKTGNGSPNRLDPSLTFSIDLGLNQSTTDNPLDYVANSIAGDNGSFLFAVHIAGFTDQNPDSAVDQALCDASQDPASIESCNLLTSVWVANSATVVPVPAAVWLFGSGLLGLAGIARRKTA